MAGFKEHGFDPGAKSGDVALKCLTLAFWDFPKLSVVAVNGLAIGGAANVALANYHDIVLASTDAYFKYPFSDIGLTPELGSSFMLPQMVGMTRAKYLLMVGDKLSAADAKEMGLVLEVTTPEELLPRARHYAEELASKQLDALMLSKKLINGHLRQKVEQVLDIENDVFLNIIGNFRKVSKM
jgi:enoyl-CoA hydratase/carnithine racemase